jgi:hypothetical protein
MAVISPVMAFHNRAVPSSLVVTIRWLSGENAACRRRLVWPWSVSSSCPVTAFHTRARLSSLSVTTRLPSGEKAA